MKTISLRQPWAYLICSGVKPIENRTWKCPQKYIGERVLIHASEDRKLNLMHLSSDQYIDFLNKIDISTLKPCDQWPRSAIIGSVRFVDCVISHPSIWAEKTEVVRSVKLDEFLMPSGFEVQEGKPIYNWVATDAVLFEKPILNVKGKLNFWDYDLPEEYETILKI